MTNKNQHEDSSCPVEQDVLEESTEEILEESEQNSENGFSEFNFSEELIQTISDKGYSSPTPIQKAAIPEVLLGRDLVGQAQTGTGKTAAFALPILERLKKNIGHPQVLVLAPTRELAMQVAESFRTYSAGHPHFKVLAIYGLSLIHI